MPDRAPSTKQGCNCRAFGYLVRACIVSRLSFVEVASAEKPAGDALPDIPVDGLTEHILSYHLSRVGHMGFILQCSLVG